MNKSPLEKDTNANTDYSKLDQRPPTFSDLNSNQQNFEFPSQGPPFERGSLKNLSNDELERLIQLKTQHIEKLQTSTLFPPLNTQQGGLSVTTKSGSSTINQIFSKYSLTPGKESQDPYDKKLTENKMFDIDSGRSGQTPGFPTTSGLDLARKGIEPGSRLRSSLLDPLKGDSIALNVAENPYLSNLESSYDRIDLPQRHNAKEIDIFQQEYGTNREYQGMTSVQESSPLRLSGSGRPPNKDNVTKTLSLGQLTPKQGGLPKPTRGSPAIAGAMKALQDKVENAEAEVAELRRKLGDVATEKQREFEEQRRKMYRELEEYQRKENELLKTVETQNIQNFQLQNELTRLKLTNQSNEEQVQSLRKEVGKLKEEVRNVQQENNVIRREIMLVENEKNVHLEQNANDRDSYERRIEELTFQLEEERLRCEQLEKQKEDAETYREDASQELKRITHEASILERESRERINLLEQQLDETLKQNQAIMQEYSSAVEKYERERGILQKKINEFDKRIEGIVIAYEEKLDAFKEENKELKAAYSNQNDDVKILRKRVSQLEKENTKLETDRKEKRIILKQVMEMNDDLLRKIKKDPNDIVLQNIIFKKKKIELDLHNKNSDRNTKKGSLSGRKKSISKSRSPSANRPQKKESLSIEDLNYSHGDSQIEALVSGSKKKKLTSSEGHDQPASLSNSKASKSLKASNDHDNRPQRSTPVVSKRENSTRSEDMPSRQVPNLKTYTSEETSSAYNFVSNLGIPGTTSTEGGRKVLVSVSSHDFAFQPKTVVETASSQQNRGIKVDFDIDKMSSNQISAEIVRIERDIFELKREYKNLLAKSQSNIVENTAEMKLRLNQIANELQEKSELHLLVKKKQRELLSRNL